MAKFEATVYGDFDRIAQQLHQDIMQNALSMNLVDESRYYNGGVRAITSVYDKYYMRNSSRASLTVTLIQDGQNVFVSAISAGGGNGALIRFSWGAEENFARLVEQSLLRNGYLS
jgi:hypothetical protein